MSREFMFRIISPRDFVISEADSFLERIEDEARDRMGIRLKEGITDGCYICEPLDSGIPECQWHRFLLEAEVPENSYIRLRYYLAESREMGVENQADLDSLPDDYPVLEMTFQKARDVLVAPAGGARSPRGRYLYLIFNLIIKNEEMASPVFFNLQVFYQRLSYLRYLPQFLQDDARRRSFLERFLGIFETSFYESEEDIMHASRYIDPGAAPYDFISWLAKWVSLDLYELLNERNREFVLLAYQLYKQKGTLAGITKILSFLTGKKCRVKEFANNIFRVYGREHTMREPVYMEDERINYGYYRRPSCTVNTDRLTNRNLLGKIGDFGDEIHYTIDTGGNSRYARDAIGIYIFVDQEDLGFNVNEEEILKVVRAFLPVFVRIVEFRIVYGEKEEVYPLNAIRDSCRESLRVLTEEEFTGIAGRYRDNQGWRRLVSNDPECLTNHPGFRTFYPEVEHWHDA